MPSFGWKTGIFSTILCLLVICFSIHRSNLSYHLLGLIALLIHEFSHMLCCEICGYPVRQFSLNPLGGCLKIDPSFIINPQSELLIAAAGPLANLLMAGGVIYLQFLGVKNLYLTYWLQINLLIGFINLIPAVPLDGSRILHALLNRSLGLKNSFLIIKRLTLIIGLLFLLLGAGRLYQRQAGLFYIIIAIFILFQMFSFKNPGLNLILKTLQHKKRRLTVNGFLHIRPVFVEPTALIRLPLLYYGGTDYLLFFIPNKDQKMSIISEESAWNILINQGFDATFSMVAKVSTNKYCTISSDEIE
jgi:Zn-dependent proteases